MFVVEAAFDIPPTDYVQSAVLSTPGDEIQLIRDAERCVTVVVTAAASQPDPSMPQEAASTRTSMGLLIKDWSLSFCVVVNGVVHKQGPVRLLVGDVVELCLSGCCDDSHRFRIRSAEGASNSLASSPFTTKVEEGSKWENFYSYRYSSVTIDDRDLPTTWDRFLTLNGEPRMLIVSYCDAAHSGAPTAVAAPPSAPEGRSVTLPPMLSGEEWRQALSRHPRRSSSLQRNHHPWKEFADYRLGRCQPNCPVQPPSASPALMSPGMRSLERKIDQLGHLLGGTRYT